MAKNTRKAAKAVLLDAVRFVGRDVVVIGEDLVATSISLNSSKDIQRALTLVNEARKKLLRWQREREQQEKTHAVQALKTLQSRNGR
jgi:hypothetical protein